MGWRARWGGGTAFWQLSDRADPVANRIAKRHYNCQSPDSDQWVKPGACLCLRTESGDAVWSSSFPLAEWTKHAWAGAWENTTFRNESPHRASDMIREAVAITVHVWGRPPPLGMLTLVDPAAVAAKSDPGHCYIIAGFRPAGVTLSGKLAFLLAPERMPDPRPPLLWQEDLLSSARSG